MQLYIETLHFHVFAGAFHGSCSSLFERGQYTHCCHRVCEDCLSAFIIEGKKCKKCPNLSNVVYTKNCVEMLGLWNCRDFEIDNILEFHEVLEGCKKFTRIQSALVVQCIISNSSTLYLNTIQGLNLPKNIELHITYSNTPNSSVLKKMNHFGNMRSSTTVE